MINTTQNSQSVLHITRGWTSDSFTIMTDFPWNNYCDSDIYYSPACPNKNGIGRLPALAVCTVVKFWYIFHNLARVNCWYFYKTIIMTIYLLSCLHNINLIERKTSSGLQTKLIQLLFTCMLWRPLWRQVGHNAIHSEMHDWQYVITTDDVDWCDIVRNWEKVVNETSCSLCDTVYSNTIM